MVLAPDLDGRGIHEHVDELCLEGGIGSALLDAVEAEFERLGVDDLVIGVLPGNVDAVRLYERRGFGPTWLYLSRFADRNGIV